MDVKRDYDKKTNLIDKRFILAQSTRMQLIMAIKSGLQELVEIAGHIILLVKKQKVRNASAQLGSSFLYYVRFIRI